MGAPPQRAGDWNFAFHVRPVVVDLGTHRHTISPLDAQLLLGELARLPAARHRAAAATAEGIVRSLAGGRALSFDDVEQRSVLRAIEGIRMRRSLPRSLDSLRGMLAQRLAEPVV